MFKKLFCLDRLVYEVIAVCVMLVLILGVIAPAMLSSQSTELVLLAIGLILLVTVLLGAWIKTRIMKY